MSNIYGAIYIAHLKSIAIHNKYTNWYCSIIESACQRFKVDQTVGIEQNRRRAVKDHGYMEGHHIVPKSVNPIFDRDHFNIVYLTAREHFIVHLLLVKMFQGENKSKMIFAFRRMQTGHKGCRYTSRLISYLRPCLPAANKNKIYITNGLDTKYHPKHLPIPHGWKTGAGINYKLRRRQINVEAHQTTYQFNYLDGSTTIVRNLKEWCVENKIPYPTIVNAARINSLVRSKFMVKVLAP